jgi:PKD repeat protein
MRKALRALVSIAMSLGVAGLVISTSGPALAVQTPQDRLVSPVPVSWTPNAVDGSVQSIVQIGNTIVMGGDFTQVEAAGSDTVLNRPYILAFNATTGALSTTFLPQLDGTVEALLPSADGKSVYVGGAFHTVNGNAAKSLTELSLADGSTVSTFKTPSMNGQVKDLRLSGGRLWAAGSFTVIGGETQTGLATINPNTGAVTPYMQQQIAGTWNGGSTNVPKIDITPDGSRLVAIGNFTTVGGQSRPQVFMLDLTGASAQLANWQTNFYTSRCSSSFNSYMRDLDISPDGSYVVISTTGAYHGSTSACDETSRWNMSATGSGLSPAWTDYTGGDTTYAVAITGTAVYVGGHMRWQNNPYAGDSPGQGAVERTGIAALDPANGLPYSWNPTRTRGVGVFDMLATDQGLWVGSDTDRIGNYAYHGKIALLPLAGGEVVPPTTTGVLPGHVYLAGSTTQDQVQSVGFSGTTVLDHETLPDTGISWHLAHGATMINGNVYYGYSDGQLYARTFDGTSFGPATAVDGMDQLNPLAYFHSDVTTITAMFFDSGRLYYTLSGDSHLYYRYFTPESNVVGGLRFTASNGITGMSFASATGMFVAGGKLYLATSNGNLQRSDFVDGAPAGTGSVVSGPGVDGTNWSSRAMFLYAPAGGSQVNEPPTARMSVDCQDLVCSMTGDTSSDPEGLLSSYHWEFGDGGSSSQTNPSHTYTSAGSYEVTLKVTDAGGLSDTTTQTVHVGSQGSGIAYVGSDDSQGNATNQTVTVPPAVSAGDGMVLVTTVASDTVTPTAPAGWTQVGQTTSNKTISTVWQRVATGGDAGSNVRVTFSAQAKATVSLFAYSGTSTTAPVLALQGAGETTSRAAHTTPTVSVSDNQAWGLSYWADNSSTTTSWNLPAGVSSRSTVCGTGGGHICTAAADSNGPVTGNQYGGLTATADSTSAKAVMWTVLLAGASAAGNQPPTARIATSCQNLVCSMTGDTSSDPEGPIASYQWDFGDGGSSSQANPSHTYADAGTYQVSLTVTDAGGVTDTATKALTVSAAGIAFVGADESQANATNQTVTVPSPVSAGDGMVLVTTVASDTVTPTAPAGWTQVGRTTSSRTTSTVWQRVATGGDAGSNVRVTFSAQAKATVSLFAYSGTSTTAPVLAFQGTGETTSRAGHTTPTVNVSTSNAWALSYWADNSSTTTSWNLPAGVTSRSTVCGTGGGHICTAAADSNGPVSGNQYGGLTATADSASAKAVMWTVLLDPR